MKRLLPLLLAGLLTACAGGGGGMQYYIVDPVEGEVLRGGGPLSIEVLDLRVPQYLESPRIATRSSENQLRFSQNHQWGDNLRKNLLRTLARNLAHSLDTVDVGTPLSRSSSRADIRILAHIEQFEQAADGRVKLSARWHLVDGGDQQTLASHSLDLTGERALPARDYAAVVASMRALFARFSHAVAESVVAQVDTE